MQFIIEQTNLKKYFCKDHTKVIVFDSEQDAYAFAQNFYNYAMPEAMMSAFNGDPTLVQSVMSSSDKWKVIPLPADFKAETINYSEIKK